MSYKSNIRQTVYLMDGRIGDLGFFFLIQGLCDASAPVLIWCISSVTPAMALGLCGWWITQRKVFLKTHSMNDTWKQDWRHTRHINHMLLYLSFLPNLFLSFYSVGWLYSYNLHHPLHLPLFLHSTSEHPLKTWTDGTLPLRFSSALSLLSLSLLIRTKCIEKEQDGAVPALASREGVHCSVEWERDREQRWGDRWFWRDSALMFSMSPAEE